MSVKERILLLGLLEKQESHPEFLAEIGVVATLKEKDKSETDAEIAAERKV